MKKSQLWLPLTTFFSGVFMAGFIIAGFLVVLFSRELPDATDIQGIQLKVPLRVYSADNLLISEFGDERREPLSFEEIPQNLINSVLAAEDDGYYTHKGIDLKGLVRAAISNFRSGSSGQGASTITMQVARNFFLTRDKTYTRKIKEVLLALRLEQILTKEEILSLYINKIFLGHRSYGFGAAAQTYYSKELNELSEAEIAMLAGLPKAPSTFNPLRNPERAKIRRNYVLGRLKDLQLLSENDYKTAIEAPITAQKHVKKADLAAPHIAEMVRAQLTEQFGEEAYWQGFNVHTTIRAKQQIAAEKALRAGLQAYDRRHGFRGAVGKVKLDQLTEIDGTLDAAYENVLADYPNSREQVPALVLQADEDVARVWTRDHGELSLLLKHAKWAKRHKTANLVGDRPKAFTDILNPGYIVYIQPRAVKSESKSTSTADSNVDWQLSQIPSVAGALISMEPDSGRIVSLIGGYDFFLNKYNRATQSIRQPGSNIKPFIYSASLEKGFTPASLISGAPIVITDRAHGTVWRPENYSGRFFGPTRMREALSKSMNLVSIRLLRSIGIPYTREYISRFGIDMDRFSASLTMALGSGGATPLDVLNAYSVLANGGYKIKPYFIEKITDRNGKVIFQAPQPEFCDECFADYLPKPELLEEFASNDDSETDSDSELDQEAELTEPDALGESPTQQTDSYEAPRVMSHANNFLTVNMMKDVVRLGTARKALVLKRNDLAGKTGTTNDYVDAWFTGFNSQVATTVWVGFDDPTTLGRGEAGSKAALPIWIDYMKTGLAATKPTPEKIPDFIEEGFVNRATGKRTDEFDPNGLKEYFVIDELTPEYYLQKTLYENLAAEGLLPEDFEGLTPQSNDAELGDDGEEFIDSIQPLDPNDRIIESEEETEGLF